MNPLAGSEGDPRADVWAIGRDYGETERIKDKPFQGLAGSRLDTALGSAGFRREKLFIHNVVAKQPPRNLWELHAPGDVAEGVANLQGLIRQHQPKLIIALGNQALRVALGAQPDDATVPGIQEVRGFLWDSPLGPRVIGAVHPAAAEREWVPWMKLLFVDLAKAKREIDAGCPPLQSCDVRVVTEPAELQELRNAMGDEIALDIENTGDLDLACLGVAVNERLAWTIPAREAWQLTAIHEICASPVAKILHNGQYDAYFLRYLTHGDAARTAKYGIRIENFAFDTQLAWHCLQPELAGKALGAKRRYTRKSLAFLSSVYTRFPFWKDYEFASEEERYTLCGRDVCATFAVKRKLAEELR